MEVSTAWARNAQNMARPAIDPGFRFMEISGGATAIGALPSGMFNDGADGLIDLKRCGEMKMAQNRLNAFEREMPHMMLLAKN